MDPGFDLPQLWSEALLAGRPEPSWGAARPLVAAVLHGPRRDQGGRWGGRWRLWDDTGSPEWEEPASLLLGGPRGPSVSLAAKSSQTGPRESPGLCWGNAAVSRRCGEGPPGDMLCPSARTRPFPLRAQRGSLRSGLWAET